MASDFKFVTIHLKKDMKDHALIRAEKLYDVSTDTAIVRLLFEKKDVEVINDI